MLALSSTFSVSAAATLARRILRSRSVSSSSRTMLSMSNNSNSNNNNVGSNIISKHTNNNNSIATATTIGTGSLNHAAGGSNVSSNTNMDTINEYKQYLEPWSLKSLMNVHQLLIHDQPEDDQRYAYFIHDFMKRIEINSNRLTDLQSKIESFHSKLRNIQSNHSLTKIDTNNDGIYDLNIQSMMHVLEDQRKALRNLQRLHVDTWESVGQQYKSWAIVKDNDPFMEELKPKTEHVTDPKKRLKRWNSLIQTASEIQARHAMTIEQMSELVIKLKPLKNYNTSDEVFYYGSVHFTKELQDVYDTVCAFMRCRMTQQLLCQHLIAMGKNDETIVARKMKRAQKQQQQQQQQAKENAKQVEEAATAAAKEKEAKVNSNIVLARNKKRLELQKQQKEEEEKKAKAIQLKETNKKLDYAFAFDAPPPTSASASSSPLSSQPPPSAIVGAINVNSSVAALLRDSITEASQLCEATYLISPPVTFITAMKYENEAELIKSGSTTTTVSTNDEDVVVVGRDDDVENEGNNEDVSATFVRSWLQYTLVELLKNAMSATVEQNPDIVNELVGDEFELDELYDENPKQQQQQQQQPLLLPSLYVHIYEDTTSDNVIIKLYDQGGGISKKNNNNSKNDGNDTNDDDVEFDLESLFRFAQRETVWDRLDEQQSYGEVSSPLKGLGVGLSLSRWHMRHFGGDLTLEHRPSVVVLNNDDNDNGNDNDNDHKKQVLRVRCDSGRRSKWYTVQKGMTATISIPKDDDISLVIS